MTANTTEINRSRYPMDKDEPVWLFGYGSLIWKADFPFMERREASIEGWSRRFWQGSHDHRGTVESPGRVVTLIAEEGARCKGMAYKVEPGVFAHLDHREKNGYLRFMTRMSFANNGQADGLVYIAAPDNAAFLGSAPIPEIAAQIARSSGPSGRNDEYLLKLADALRSLGHNDRHVFDIEHFLLAECQAG
jgi:cation transport protein ChaC